MAKKNRNKKESAKRVFFEDRLPQNILFVGEKTDDDKNIYISQETYKNIHDFTKDKLTNESGGILVGHTVEAFGKTNILIEGFVEAKFCEATPTTLKFTHKSWDYIHEQIRRKYENGCILGWIHTHPSFGIFLSDYDKFIHENFFKETNQVAYVVDPIQNIEGFYYWMNGKLCRCTGFYIFDKTGVDIDVIGKSDKKEAAAGRPLEGKTVLLYGALVVILIFLFLIVVKEHNIAKRLEIIENQQENLVTSANQSIGYLKQRILYLEEHIQLLEEKVSELEQENSPNSEMPDINANETENESE